MTYPTNGWFPIECSGELARAVKEHNERVARDVEAAKWRQLCATSERLVADVSAPSEYSPVATEAKPPFMPDNGPLCANGIQSAYEFGWGPTAKPPVRNYCAETAERIAAIDAEANGFVDAALAKPVVTWAWVPGPADTIAAFFAKALADCDAKIVASLAPPPPSREDERRAIDALLRDDARRTPAFATARRAAVLAYAEESPYMGTLEAKDMLRWCARYESIRGGMAKPSVEAQEYAEDRSDYDAAGAAFNAYERARRMR